MNQITVASANVADDAPAPEWSTGYAKHITDVGAQLCTRDGRKIGNAVVLRWPVESHGFQFAEVVTDAGTRLKLTEGELREFFHEPTYLMDPGTAPGLDRAQKPA